MNLKKFLKEPRILILIFVLLLSLAFINPHPIQNPETGLMIIKTNIEKGLDLEGGVRTLIKPQEDTQEIIDKSIIVLTTRINTFGLKETKILPVTVGNERYIQLELAGADEEQIRDLIERQGKFEAKILRIVNLDGGKGILKLNGKDYPINNEEMEVNGSFILGGITLEVINITENELLLYALVYKGEDILKVFKDAEHSNVRQISQDFWRFQFSILVSKESAGRFTKVTKDTNLVFDPSGETYLDTNIDLFLDDILVDSLRIGGSLKGQVLTQPQITGPGESQEDAVNKMKNLQSILESGALPTQIEIIKVESISSTLGQQFMKVAIVAILISILAVSIIIFIRYKDPKIVIPIIFTSSSEVFIILGAAAAINWTIDLAAIAGIIAAVGSGVDDQIIITDESVRRRTLSLKARLKQAFFIIMAAWATTVAAMVPLFSIAAGAVKGFALTTIIGVTIGVLITRPAYAKMIEYLRKE